MSSERWRQIQEIFEEARELSGKRREAYLEEHCSGDEALLRLARSLLAADQEAGAFMNGPLLETGGEPSATAPRTSLPKDHPVGPYRILRKLGEGGMSTVYLASRDDETFSRRVALKVVRHGMESPDTLYRLQLERRILASLEHPHIARLYDGGMVEGNLPYFAMELVEGLPIDEYCDLHHLPIAKRLKLFRKICAAVQFAHQNLVVHRDLKPSNILVDGQGEPRLLDFGIAKLLGPALSQNPEEATEAWVRLITPSYASPEQIRGQPVTTASDIYSLGVLLYKLLTGRLPFRLETRNWAELEEAVENRRPIPPSQALERDRQLPGGAEGEEAVGPPGELRGVSADRLKNLLRGDLDTIVLKAIHTSPNLRYGSPEKLSEDLLRHLQGYPIEARRESLRYRAGKFLRRHRLAVTTTAFVATLVIAGALALAFQGEQIRRERNQLREVLTFVEDVFQVAREGEQLTVREAVDRSAALLDRKPFARTEVEASLRETLGTIYLNLGVPAQARSQLEESVRLRRQRGKTLGPRGTRSLSSLGVALALLGETEEGIARAREALAEASGRYGDQHPELVRPLNDLVTAFCYGGDYEAAEAPSLRALALAQTHVGAEPSARAGALTNRAFLLGEKGQYEESIELYQEALVLHRENLGEEHPRIATLTNNLASTYRRYGDLETSEELFRETLALERKLYKGHNTNLARTLHNYGSLLRKLERYDESEKAYREARSMTLTLYHPGDYSVAATTLGLVRALLPQARSLEARQLLEEGLAHWRKSLPSSPYETYLEEAEDLFLEIQKESQDK